MQLGQHAVLTLPITAAGGWGQMPKAERLTPEKLMPRWLSPVTLRIMSEANFPISGLPLSVADAMSSHPYLDAFLANVSTSQPVN